MDRFSDAYKTARKALEGPLEGTYERRRSDLKSLLKADAPSPTKKDALNKFREELIVDGEVAYVEGERSRNAGEAKVITDAAGKKDANGKAKRAATLKMLRHFYHGQSSGGAAIWIYAPPEAYDKWLFDAVTADDDRHIKKKLTTKPDEVYTDHHRKIMVDAISQARKIAGDAAVKLQEKKEKTVDLVKQYFTGNTVETEDVDAIITTLRKGYLKIAAGLGSSSLVISDEPGDRVGGGWKDWAFIYTSEAMKVIYLQGAWLKKADEASPSNMSPLYRCARTVLHEMSHKECRTEDIVYGPRGLKPASDLTGPYAVHNADSWAYFAVDLCGFLTGPDASNASKDCTGIRRTPERELNVTI